MIQHEFEPDPFLLEPNPVPPMIPAQLIVKNAFFGGQPDKNPRFRLWLDSPE